MPKQIKEAKNIEVLVNIRYNNSTNGLEQSFEFNVSNKKYLDFLFDARFLFKNKIDALIQKMSLDGFKSRTDSRDRVTMLYASQEAPRPCIRKIQAYVPPYFGCDYCSKCQKEGDFVFCPEKQKHYTKGGVKRCPVFRTKEEIIT